MSKLTRVRIDYLSEIEGVIYKIMSLAETVPDSVGTILYKGRYVYKRDSGSPIDGINRITTADGKVWLFLTADAIYASDFCHDTQTLQAAYEFSASKYLEFIIDKNFTDLEVVTEDPAVPGNAAFMSVLYCLSGTTIRFIGEGALRIKAPDRAQSHIIYLSNNVSDVTIINPVLEGDRLTNTHNAEHGYGLAINQSKNIRVIGGSYTNMSGDGIVISIRWESVGGDVPSNIYIERPVISKCRRNGISFIAGDNVRIVQPVITDIGDIDGVVGKFPKAGIDFEPDPAPTPSNRTNARLINCVVESPYIARAYTGMDFNLFTEYLQVSLRITGDTVLDGITARGIGVSRVSHGGVGTVVIDKIVLMSLPSDLAVFEMLGNDRITFHVNEIQDSSPIAGRDMPIRLLPRSTNPVPDGLSDNFKNFSIGKCTSSVNRFVVLAGTDLSKYHVDTRIGEADDNISVDFGLGDGYAPATLNGFIGGTTRLNTHRASKYCTSTIIANPAALGADLEIDSVGDFRELTVRRALVYDGYSNAIHLKGIRYNNGGGEVFNGKGTGFDNTLVFQNNNAGVWTRVNLQIGAWSFS